ncbi:MAG: DedA family protein [Oculatellaceae cyanobacterium Prado106]|jgi:membrane protein DedA with SNARE-associated domain|nr:DedA family protein [Oculatellaceae cyanobacterium Prado106]
MSIELVPLETIQEIAHEYGYWSVFLGIMLENTGLPIPGETITLAGGFLAGSGELNYWWVMGSAIAGAAIGDNFGYWVGYYGGWPLLTRIGALFRLPEEKLLQAKTLFSKNADKAVFLGRFVALLRIFAGPMAGVARMPYPEFLACNLAGATVWAGVTITAAYFAGRIVSLETLVSWTSRFTFVALGVLVVAIALFYILENREKWLPLLKFPKPAKQED